jgi:glyoxylase-like metal-dependent hydrolase (beta-lactamase superfamily II)
MRCASGTKRSTIEEAMSAPADHAAPVDRTFGRVRVLAGAQNGKYPSGNSLLVSGSESTAIIDPSLAVLDRREELAGRADLVLLSHVHEDHVAGVSLFPGARVAAHREDAAGLRSLDGLMEIYGYEGDAADATRKWVLESFHYQARPDTEGFEDGAVFDLGGVSIRAIHAPGHTRGHTVLLAEPEGVLFLGDIDLSSFGPYYGDAWSDLADFERTLEKVRDIEAKVWVSFHHVGVIESRDEFLTRLGRFTGRIAARERAMLEFLATPHTLAEMIAHRFLYPAHASMPFIDAVEQRTLLQHLDRMKLDGRVELHDDGRWSACG